MSKHYDLWCALDGGKVLVIGDKSNFVPDQDESESDSRAQTENVGEQGPLTDSTPPPVGTVLQSEPTGGNLEHTKVSEVELHTAENMRSSSLVNCSVAEIYAFVLRLIVDLRKLQDCDSLCGPDQECCYAGDLRAEIDTRKKSANLCEVECELALEEAKELLQRAIDTKLARAPSWVSEVREFLGSLTRLQQTSSEPAVDPSEDARVKIGETGSQSAIAKEWAIGLVSKEFDRASAKFQAFRSPHEGYAVLKEEVDELWDAIKGNDLKSHMREEAMQIAAMAIHFIVDITDD